MKNIQVQKNIPSDWQQVKLGAVCDISAGGTPSTSKEEYWRDGDISWANSAEINKKNIYHTKNFITKKGLNNSSAKIIPVNSVLIALAGQGSTRGKVAVNKIPLATNQSVAFFITKNDIDYRFLRSNLERRYQELRAISAGDGGRGGLNLQILKSLKIKLPLISEQNRIVLVLETWDKAIEKLTKKIELKKNIKKGLMQRLLTGELRLAGFSDKWKTFKLGKIGETYTGITGKDKNDFGFGVPFISYMNIYSNWSINTKINDLVNIKEGDNQNKANYGDIFFTTSSETPHEVGISSVLLDKSVTTLYLNSFCFGFRLDNLETLTPEFAQYYFRGQAFRKKMTRLAQGASRFNLSKKYFLDTAIEIPSGAKEQAAIINILASSSKEIKLLEQKLKYLKEQKNYLLNNLITGAIRTPENLLIK